MERCSQVKKLVELLHGVERTSIEHHASGAFQVRRRRCLNIEDLLWDMCEVLKCLPWIEGELPAAAVWSTCFGRSKSKYGKNQGDLDKYQLSEHA